MFLQVKPSSSSSSTLSSTKLKRIIKTLVISHLCRIIRAISKVKGVVVEILKENPTIHFPSQKKHCNKRNKIILGSFRLHYNWCSSKSSHVRPVRDPVYEGLFVTVNSVENNGHSNSEDNCPDSRLAGYLRWLEEKKVLEKEEEEAKFSNSSECEMNEIDLLAEMFIANCHEKFKLEKQESDRRFQDMLARSM